MNTRNSEKITSLPKAKKWSTTGITSCSSRVSLPYNESHHDSYSQFPRSLLGTPGSPTSLLGPKYEEEIRRADYDSRCYATQGPRSKFSSGGAKEERVKENFFLGRGGVMLVDFYSISLKWRRMRISRITIKLLIFFHIFSDVAIGSENSPSLNHPPRSVYLHIIRKPSTIIV